LLQVVAIRQQAKNAHRRRQMLRYSSRVGHKTTGETMQDDRFLTPPAIAKILGVAADKVGALIASGELKAVNLSLGSARPRWKVAPADLQAFLDGRSNQPKVTRKAKRAIPTPAREYV